MFTNPKYIYKYNGNPNMQGNIQIILKKLIKMNKFKMLYESLKYKIVAKIFD